MSEKIQRLAVSGTYATGKTTITEALSLATGIPRVHASTTRELLPRVNPEKLIGELSAFELLYFGMIRMEERIHNEAAECGSFFSDGSILNEWVYGEVRLHIGIRPGASPALSFGIKTIKAIVGLRARPFIKNYVKAYGELVKNRAKRIYDGYIHLPVEFDRVSTDLHHPIPEEFRLLSDGILQDTIQGLGIPMFIASGSNIQRVAQIIEHFDLPQVMNINDAVVEAERRVEERRKKLNAEEQKIKKQFNASLKRRLKYVLHF